MLSASQIIIHAQIIILLITMQYKLIERILKLSTSQIWETAKKEWIVTEILYLDEEEEFEECLCTHYPIRELCFIMNTTNKNKTMVGNCCIKNFLGDKTKTKMFKAIAKNKINKALIDYAKEKRIITEWEFKFTTDIWRKKNLTDKQQWKFKQVKSKIISAVKKRYHE